MAHERSPAEFRVETHGWWATSRPYRVMGELVAFSLISLVAVVFVLSRTADDPSYRLWGLKPLYVISVLSGGIGGAARGLLVFWQRDNYNMLKSDYWKHATPFYIGLLFGFLVVLVLQSGLKVVGVPRDAMDPGGLSFLAAICLLSGLFADKAELKFMSIFNSSVK